MSDEQFQIQINYRDIPKTDAMDERVEHELTHALGHLTQRLTRVEAHLADENGHKRGGQDKRVMLEARPRGMDPIAVEHHGDDMYKTIADAAGKLKRALTTRFEKHDGA